MSTRRVGRFYALECGHSKGELAKAPDHFTAAPYWRLPYRLTGKAQMLCCSRTPESYAHPNERRGADDQPDSMGDLASRLLRPCRRDRAGSKPGPCHIARARLITSVNVSPT